MKIRSVNFINLKIEEKKEILDWRNSNDISKWMLTKDITLEKHLSFIERLKDDKENIYYKVIDEDKTKGIGVIYFNNIQFKNKAEIGLYLNPEFLDLKYGNILLKEILKVSKKLKIKKILVKVLKNNTRMKKFCLKNKFKITEETEQLILMEREVVSRMEKKVKIIAELSANHGHSIEIAKESIRVAKECGADAVKIQTYTAETMTLNCDKRYFQIEQGTIWDGTTLYKLYQEAYTPWEWHKELFDYANEIGIEIFSTPFDKTAVDLLEELNTPIYKIASFEINDIPLIEYAASKGKPMIISTGVGTEEEIREAVEACKRMGNNDITLLQCTSQYPAKLEDANLVMIRDLAERFGVKSGLSDHTMGSLVATTAVAMGATVVEKHFIVDRNIGGPDSSFSMTPGEFKEMVENIRNVEKMIGNVSYEITEKRKKSFKFKRSLFISKDIKKGEILTEENIRSVRPSDGISPKYYHKVLGKKASRDLKFGEPLKFEDIEGE